MVLKIVRKSTTTTTPTSGSYATASIETRPWASTAVTISRPKTRRAKPEPIIVNQIFKDCADRVEDPTWKSIFTEASLGKLPKGFMFRDGYVVHKIRNRISRLDLSSDPDIAIQECMSFFREKAGIMSFEDQSKAKTEFEDYLVKSGTLCPQRWSEVRKKKVKSVLISTFITRLCKEHNLTTEEEDNLKNTIHLGFILGSFGPEQVELDKGYIKDIYGLSFDPARRVFFIDFNKAPKQLKKTRKIETGTKASRLNYYSMWTKYIQGLQKKIRVSDQPVEPESEDISSSQVY